VLGPPFVITEDELVQLVDGLAGALAALVTEPVA
jgi:hypothetical protein